MAKKKILFHTDFALKKTGFGRNCKDILSYLEKTGKYEIINYCCNLEKNSPILQRTPWKSIGGVPPDNKVKEIVLKEEEGKRPYKERDVYYGNYLLDEVIEEEQPDFYFGVQDIWAVDQQVKKYWFPQINSCIWTTLDSLPILESTIKTVSRSENFWVWSSFAENDLKSKGLNHVKTVHGCIDTKLFFKKTQEEKLDLRKSNNIDKDLFVIGFVFRNQSRKSVDSLIKGFADFKKKIGGEAALLLHTSFEDGGWDIKKIADENGLKKEELLCTYICSKCKSFKVQPFESTQENCPFCSSEKCFRPPTTNVGVNELQLNDIYNLMDVYCHPFNSGGQEIPIQEAKLVELITLVTNYSCGEYMCSENSGSFPLDWIETREVATNFIKAKTLPNSIADNLLKVYKMNNSEKERLGVIGRQFVLDNFSVEVIGRKIEEFLDSKPKINWKTIKKPKIDPNYKPKINDLPDFISDLFFHFYGEYVDKNDKRILNWLNKIKEGYTLKSIEDHFRNYSVEKKSKENKESSNIEEFIDFNHKKRILMVMPESIGDIFLCTSLFKNIKEQYPEYALYFSCKEQYFELIYPNEFLDGFIPYMSEMDNLIWLEGQGGNNGYFDIAFLPHLGTQRLLDYLHNGETRIQFDLI